MKILTKKKLEELEKTNYNEGWSDGNSSATRMWEKELMQHEGNTRAFLLQIAENLEKLSIINMGNGIKTKKQKEIDSFIKELQDKILKNKN